MRGPQKPTFQRSNMILPDEMVQEEPPTHRASGNEAENRLSSDLYNKEGRDSATKFALLRTGAGIEAL